MFVFFVGPSLGLDVNTTLMLSIVEGLVCSFLLAARFAPSERS